MINYEKLNDTEINQLVAKTFGYSDFGFGYVDGYDGLYNYMARSGSEYSEHLPDYCNNPAHGFPIVHREGMTLIKCQDDRLWLAITQFLGKDVTRHSSTSIKPLRAAMIAYLKGK